MWNAVMVIAIVAAAGLGWFVASRRHPGSIGFSLLLLGSAGLVIASMPSLMFDASLTAEDPMSLIAGQAWASRIVGIMGAASVAFAVVAGVRALWAAPRSASLMSGTPSSPKSSAPPAAWRS